MAAMGDGNRWKPNVMLAKRDFQNHREVTSAVDFYAQYDPTVGVGTAVFLLSFFALLVAQVLMQLLVRKLKYLFAWRACNVIQWKRLPTAKRTGRQMIRYQAGRLCGWRTPQAQDMLLPVDDAGAAAGDGSQSSMAHDSGIGPDTAGARSSTDTDTLTRHAHNHIDTSSTPPDTFAQVLDERPTVHDTRQLHDEKSPSPPTSPTCAVECADDGTTPPSSRSSFSSFRTATLWLLHDNSNETIV